jgi:hypothetical protein
MESRPPERTGPRQPREEADAPNVPQPTQARADAIKEGAHGEEVGPLAAPRNVDVPYLGGDGTVGATLNCTMGNWNGEPTSYAYQWKRNGTTDIAASGDSYVVAAEDAGTAITCIVTATNDAGSTAAPPSNAVAVAAAITESETRRK